MEFDRLLEFLDDGVNQKHQVALAVYHLEEYEEQDVASPSDVKAIIQSSRSSVATSSVSSYLRRLNDDRWVKKPEEGNYRLTNDGRGGVLERLDEAVLDNARAENDLFLAADNFEEDERYKQLVRDINETYRYRIYDATMVLTRKLFEDMTFEILKTHYAGEDVEMFYDQENNRHYSFDDLLDNLKDGVTSLRRYSRELDESLVEQIRDLKDAGNAGAHSIKVDFTDDEVEIWSDDVTRIAEILYDVLIGARIADQSD
jgi:hypothetical protein